MLKAGRIASRALNNNNNCGASSQRMQPGPHLKRRMCGTTGGLRKRQHGTGKENGGIRRPSTFGIPDSRGGGSQSLGHQVVGNKVVRGIRPLL